MTRKDFEIIAQACKAGRIRARSIPLAAISDKGKAAVDAGALEVIIALADLLAHHNPRFDRARFIAATVVE